MKFMIIDSLLIVLSFFVAANASSGPTTQNGLKQQKYSCAFICLRYTQSGLHGSIYEGHQPFTFFVHGNKFEDNFEKLVLGKANLLCRGPGLVKLMDYKLKNEYLTDEMGNTRMFKRVGNHTSFAPASHCKEVSPKLN